MFQTSADVEPKHFSTSSGGHAGAPLVTDMFITHLQKQNLQNFHHDNTLTPNTS